MVTPPTESGSARIGVLGGFAELCRELGADPAAILGNFGLDEGVIEHRDSPIPLTVVERIIAAAAHATHCPHFALRLAENQSLPRLYPGAVLALQQPTVGDGLRAVQAINHIYNQGVVIDQFDEGDRSAFVYRYRLSDPAPLRHLMTLVAVLALKLLQLLCGPQFQADEAVFAFSRPVDIDPFRKLFRCRLEFRREFSGIYFDRRLLDQPLASANPLLADIIAEHFRSRAGVEEAAWPNQVSRFIRTLLPSGRANIAQVAQLCGISRRTLHRHLAEGGTTFQALLAESRSDTAKRLLRAGALPITEIAAILGFADAATFARAFRRQFGVSPTAYRAESVDE